MIVSSDYLRDTHLMIDPKHFKVDYIRKISQWILEYYKKYKAAPGKDFESIFYAKTAKLKAAELEIMESFLQSLSDQYISDNQDSYPFNKELRFDETVTFCRDRSLEILQKTIEGYRLEGNFTKAEETLFNYGKVAQNVSQWINPLDESEIDKTFDEDEENKLFKLPGPLGDLIGWLQRGWFVSIMGSAKKGKSFYEWEIGFHALCAGLKVAIFSFEMNKTVYKKRVYKKMTAMAENGGEYAFPVFDCKRNQKGTCTKTERENKITLLNSADELPTYTKDMDYKPCTACRKLKTKDYQPTSWWQTQYQKENLSPEAIKKKVKTFKKLFGDNLRLRCFPAFTAGLDEAIAELENLRRQGFDADVVLFDYLDITAAEVANELEDENRKWKRSKGLAGLLHLLFVNCNQGNRGSEESKNMKQKHTGGNIKKLQHVDMDITLNQTEQEKKRGMIRFEILVHRHDEGIEKGQVIVLQQLKLGQPFLDSEWNRKEED
jgi:hypothetical protein